MVFVDQMCVCIKKISHSMQGNPRQSWILDSTPWIPVSLSMELGFWISFGGFRISCMIMIPKPRILIPQSKIS